MPSSGVMGTSLSPSSLPDAPLFFQRSARRDLRFWLMLLVGLLFAWAGSTVDPATNCDSSGDCAPWLVPVAKWMGIGFTLIATGTLWANPRRGSCIDPASGDLVWWQGRVGAAAGDEGRIHPSRIAMIRIVGDSDGADGVHLFDQDGERQPYFDAEVIPWPQTDWAERFARQWPHVRVEIEG